MTTYRIVMSTLHSKGGEWIAQVQIATRGAGLGEGEGRSTDELAAMLAAVREAYTQIEREAPRCAP